MNSKTFGTGRGKMGDPVDSLSVNEARELLMKEELAWQEETNTEAVETAAAGAIDALEEEAATDERPSDEQEAVAQSFAEGAVGLGVDIVEIKRMSSILKRSPSFAKHVFSSAEQKYCNKRANPATHYALRFAAKEAVVKALGTGIAEGIGVLDIEVERAANGRPSIKLSGRALEIANEQGIRSLSISLSYTHTDAVACALAVTDASTKAAEKRKDPMEELAKQFKETRGILDEL